MNISNGNGGLRSRVYYKLSRKAFLYWCNINSLITWQSHLQRRFTFHTRDAIKKLLRRRQNPIFLAHQKGDIFLWGRGQIFLSHVPCSFLCFCLHTICAFLHHYPLLWEVCKNWYWKRIESTLNPFLTG